MERRDYFIQKKGIFYRAGLALFLSQEGARIINYQQLLVTDWQTSRPGLNICIVQDTETQIGLFSFRAVFLIYFKTNVHVYYVASKQS